MNRTDIYTERMSFFRLMIRKVGDADWDEPAASRVFAIRGRNPQEINNMIRIGFKERANTIQIYPHLRQCCP